ncbi:hypothetical protein LINPERPRIM_LOCUS31694 [Linum perenne]
MILLLIYMGWTSLLCLSVQGTVLGSTRGLQRMMQ